MYIYTKSQLRDKRTHAFFYHNTSADNDAHYIDRYHGI